MGATYPSNAAQYAVVPAGSTTSLTTAETGAPKQVWGIGADGKPGFQPPGYINPYNAAQYWDGYAWRTAQVGDKLGASTAGFTQATWGRTGYTATGAPIYGWVGGSKPTYGGYTNGYNDTQNPA